MRVSFWQPMDGTVLSPDAIARMTGKTVPFTMAGMPRGLATVVAVRPAGDGSGAEWTVDILDVDGDVAAAMTTTMRGFSVAWPSAPTSDHG